MEPKAARGPWLRNKWEQKGLAEKQLISLFRFSALLNEGAAGHQEYDVALMSSIQAARTIDNPWLLPGFIWHRHPLKGIVNGSMIWPRGWIRYFKSYCKSCLEAKVTVFIRNMGLFASCHKY